MKKIYLFLLVSLCFSIRVLAQEAVPIIPLPVEAEKKEGVFQIDVHTPLLVSSPILKDIASYFRTEMLRLKSMPLTIQKETSAPAISFELTDDMQGEEAYEVVVETEGVKIKGSTPEGVFNAAVSVLQLIVNSQNKGEKVQIDNWKIKDEPHYKWRGLMLDESRFFMGKEKVKSILDWMAFYKLNRFHWHLTDESGWRLEIKKYPKLALIGGIGNHNDPEKPAAYYTQKEIEEIVDYAAKRNIVVIPEIDMPGHATAANRAYPEYSGGGSEKYPEFTFDPGNPETYTYLTNILRETNVLFPSNMIHLGGDEVSFGSEKWKENEGIQQLMTKYKLENLNEVEYHFMKQMADSVYKMNAKVLVWDELAATDLPRNKTIIYWWRHDKPQQLQLALDKGYQTVLCPRLPYYFDFVQDSAHRTGRKWDGRYNTLQDVYNFSADSLLKNKEQLSLIKGIQANLWAETITSLSRVDYLLFPRLAALSEATWSIEKNKSFKEFEERLELHLELYRAQRVYFYNPFNPQETPEPVIF